jgi:hypothetical protein
MPEYLVKWEIEVDALTPKAAAEQARRIQLDPESWATIFEVIPTATMSSIEVEDVFEDV